MWEHINFLEIMKIRNCRETIIRKPDVCAWKMRSDQVVFVWYLHWLHKLTKHLLSASLCVCLFQASTNRRNGAQSQELLCNRLEHWKTKTHVNCTSHPTYGPISDKLLVIDLQAFAVNSSIQYGGAQFAAHAFLLVNGCLFAVWPDVFDFQKDPWETQ